MITIAATAAGGGEGAKTERRAAGVDAERVCFTGDRGASSSAVCAAAELFEAGGKSASDMPAAALMSGGCRCDCGGGSDARDMVEVGGGASVMVGIGMGAALEAEAEVKAEADAAEVGLCDSLLPLTGGASDCARPLDLSGRAMFTCSGAADAIVTDRLPPAGDTSAGMERAGGAAAAAAVSVLGAGLEPSVGPACSFGGGAIARRSAERRA